MSGRSERVLVGFVAERVLDARARQAARRGAPPVVMARPLVPAAASLTTVRPLPSTSDRSRAAGMQAIVVSLPGDAWCVIPAAHLAHRSATAARALARALTDALLATDEPSDT
jgi:hypothetical protein